MARPASLAGAALLGLTALAVGHHLHGVAAAQARPAFEVADVHASPVRPDGREVVMSGGGSARGGRYEIDNATLFDLIRTAYAIEIDAIVGGPTWLNVDRFDVVAKAADSTAPAALNLMLQSLLAERFGLVAREDTRSMPAWVLAKGPGEPKLKRPARADESGCRLLFEINRVSCRNVTLDAFVASLQAERATRLPVFNATGIAGAWDFDIDGVDLARARGIYEGGPMLDAVDRQLGLKLTRELRPRRVIVVDSINRVPTPNEADLETRLPPDPVEFDVAAIRPCEAVAPRGWRISPSGHVTTGCQTLRAHIERAWNLGPQQDSSNGFRDLAFGRTRVESAVRFLDSKRFDIAARAPVPIVGIAGDAKYTAMLRNLLTTRFRMVTRYESRVLDAYSLVAATPRLQRADPSGRTECTSSGLRPVTADSSAGPANGYSTTLTCRNATVGQLVDALNKTLAIFSTGRRVIDETGIQGRWDLTLTYRYLPPPAAAPGEPTDPAGASITVEQALEQRLGLKLLESRRPVPVFVIQHIEENPVEN
jgi:uncharacterized protein (TIGR03435 family)